MSTYLHWKLTEVIVRVFRIIKSNVVNSIERLDNSFKNINN